MSYFVPQADETGCVAVRLHPTGLVRLRAPGFPVVNSYRKSTALLRRVGLAGDSPVGHSYLPHMHATAHPPWRVVLIEDHDDTRRFFESCIEQNTGLLLAASFGALTPALRWFESHGADLLVTDLQLPDGSGITALKAVARLHPACDKLVITMFGDEDHVVASIEAGAVGYVHKDANMLDIAQVLLDVKQGASPISPMVARGLLARLKQLKGSPDATSELAQAPATALLTKREREMLDLLARGYMYAEIASLSAISLHTVQGHVKNIYSKLAVRSRAEAVFEASRLGIISSFGSPP